MKQENNSSEKAVDGKAMIDIAKQIKQQMKDFYKNQYSSSIDFQNTIKNRGFSFLHTNVEEAQTIVEIGQAQQIVDIYLQNLAGLLPAKIYDHCRKFLTKWKSISLNKFVKKQILFSQTRTSDATFIGVYQKRTSKQLYLCYKVCRNAFRLAPDIYVVHETQSQSVAWGAFQSNSKTDRLMEVTRGFNIEDLKALLQITSVSILDLNTIKELQ